MDSPRRFGAPLPATMVAVLEAFWAALHAGRFHIIDRHGRPNILRPNALQKRIWTAWYRQAKAGKPLRIIVLKGRKQGVSTFVQAFFMFVVMHYAGQQAQLLAHAEPETDEIFNIARRFYVQYDAWSVRPADPAGHEIRLTEHDSSYGARTGGAEYPLSGGNYLYLHISELAKWRGTAAALAARLESVLQSMPDTPMSCGVIESTANPYDETQEFETRYRLSMSGRSPWEAVFGAWWEEPEYVKPGPALESYDHDPEEAAVREKYGLSDEQLRWRRDKIDGDFKGSVWAFQISYPNTPEEAFQAASGKVFPSLSYERHNWHAPVAELQRQGWQFYAGLDWGGADPFCHLWIAHHKAGRGYSCDVAACPNHWREMTSWVYGRNSKPVSRDDHSIDPLRYVLQGLVGAVGHFHVFSELYEPFSAARGKSDLDWLREIEQRNAQWDIAPQVVADRSQPMTINLFAQHGYPVTPFQALTPASAAGEIVDGVALLNNLIIDSQPLRPPDPELSDEDRMVQIWTSGRFKPGTLEALRKWREYQLDRKSELGRMRPARMGRMF